METTARRTFQISGYANIHGILLDDPRVRRSAVFTVGGYGWCIHYYPWDGDDGDCIGLYLQLATQGARATATFHFSLLDHTASLLPFPLVDILPWEFDSDDPNRKVLGQVVPKNVLNEVPGSGYFTRDGMLIECTVTVVPPEPSGDDGRSCAQAAQPMAVPPSDMMDQLRDMYASGHGTDVTFSVGGELIRAHKVILAMRSPVFRAELYGEMMEGRAHHVEVQDMRPDALRTLLRYIYTDTFLPAAAPARGEEDEEGSSRSEMVQDVPVAADRYGVGRLKLICERQLCKVLDVGNVAQMLAFADDHHCSMLRDACARFIATTDRTEDVVATQGYAQLVSTRPLVLIEVLEKSHKFRNV